MGGLDDTVRVAQAISAYEGEWTLHVWIGYINGVHQDLNDIVDVWISNLQSRDND